MRADDVAAATRPPGLTVADVMHTTPTCCDARTTVAQLRRFFEDPHVHCALVVDDRTLLAVVDREDLTHGDPRGHAIGLGTLAGRIVPHDTGIDTARRIMQNTGRRRLAVVDVDGRLAGLLCRKRSGRGFCSDDDVAGRHRDARG